MKNFVESGNNFYDFIKNHLNDDPHRLRLSYAGKSFPFDIDLAITQIECRRKNSSKLAIFQNIESFLYPTSLAAEQATHQCVAAYHAKLVDEFKGTRPSLSIIDITAGLGIDSLTLAMAGNSVTALELERERADALSHNAIALGAHSLNVFCTDSLKWLADMCSDLDSDSCQTMSADEKPFDLLFADPARRASGNRRTYFFADCVPDIVSNRNLLFNSARRIMIKSSPIVDLTQACREFPAISEIHLVCVRGECKEVLLIANPDIINIVSDPIIVAVDLEETADASISLRSRQQFRMSEISSSAPLAEFDDLKEGVYIYDPNAAVHKINCGANLCSEFEGLRKLAANTDLYCSAHFHPDFPGRVFRLENILDNKLLKTLKGLPREVIARNYPIGTEALRKKLALKSGCNDFYIIAAKVGKNSRPFIFDCRRIICNNSNF